MLRALGDKAITGRLPRGMMKRTNLVVRIITGKGPSRVLLFGLAASDLGSLCRAPLWAGRRR